MTVMSESSSIEPAVRVETKRQPIPSREQLETVFEIKDLDAHGRLDATGLAHDLRHLDPPSLRLLRAANQRAPRLVNRMKTVRTSATAQPRA